MNFLPLLTLFSKEMLRTRQVLLQAVLSPVISTVLYFVVFGAAIGGGIQPIAGISYGQFIVPGLIMMALLTNSVMAASSGIYFPRFIGTIGDLLMSPMSLGEIFLGYALAAATRSLGIGLLIYLSALPFTPVPVAHPLFVIVFAFLTTFAFSLLGVIIGVWAKDFEQLSFFPSLVIMPLAFLGGVFYSAEMLPPLWRALTLANPIFYMVDGLRWGFFDSSHLSPFFSTAAVGALLLAAVVTLGWIAKTGYRIKN